MTPMPPPSWATVFGTWQVSWVGDALVVLLAVAYVLGVRRWPGHWPAARSVAFACALIGLVVTFDSGVAVFGHGSFGVHMVMHLMLIMVVPALLVAGQPLRLLRNVAPQRHETVVSSAVARGLAHPVTVFVLYGLVIVLTHLTGFMDAMAGDMALHHGEQVLYLVAGYLFFLTALGVDAGPTPPSYFGRFVLMMIAMGVDTLVGVVLLLSPHSPFAAYELGDVRVGGALMWAGGDGLMMLLVVALGRLWTRDPHRGADLGPWLESARRSALSGRGSDGVAEQAGDVDDVDDDDEALAAYNRMLARLNGGGSHHR